MSLITCLLLERFVEIVVVIRALECWHILLQTAFVNATSSRCNSAISEFLDAKSPPTNPRATAPPDVVVDIFYEVLSW
ncbi:hypothetical protein PGB90_006734 [Kerria lacca]